MNRTAVEEIKSRLPIEEVIGSYLKLEKAGKSYKARCPFHNEKTPSFYVSPDRGGYYCFGCNSKGDIFSFVEQFEGLDFKGALKVLADKAGVPLVQNEKLDNEKDRLHLIMELSTNYYEECLSKDIPAKDYLKKRGINDETIKSFRIGYAPVGWENLYNFLKKKGFDDSIIEKAGLAKKKEGGNSMYDRFRGRIMFPITDTSGRVLGFTGRILVDDEKSAKYLNSPDTPLFNKSQVLFGLDKAKSEIRRLGYSILVEGQMDLILSHQSGVKNTVAASGTALGSSSMTNTTGLVGNLVLVKRLAPNMIIALDSDQAGRVAAMKAVASTALSMGMSVKIADIEGGKDPADLILSDPQLWKDVLKNAKHVIMFEADNIFKEVSDPHKIPKELRERVFPFLARIDSEMDKAVFVKQIAERANISLDSVWEDLRRTEKNLKQSGDNYVINGRENIPHNLNTAPESVISRVALIEKRLFGLLGLLESSDPDKASHYKSEIKNISGDKFEKILASLEPYKEDYIYEAEAYFGSDRDKYEMHMRELLLNFEEDIVNEELAELMHQLRQSEKSKEMDKASVYSKRCQELFQKKTGIMNKRKSYSKS